MLIKSVYHNFFTPLKQFYFMGNSIDSLFKEATVTVWQSFKSLFAAQSKEEVIQQAKINFGEASKWEQYKNEFKGYSLALKLGHALSIVLSYFCIYAFVLVPVSFMTDSPNIPYIVGSISVGVLGLYELGKAHVSGKGSVSITKSFGENGNFLNLFSIYVVLMGAMCYGSYKMCQSGSEDLLAEVTDQTQIIASDGTREKDSVARYYDASAASAVSLLKSELETIRADKKEYVKLFGKRTWDSEVKQKIHDYSEQIKAKEQEIKDLKKQYETEKKTAVSEVKVKTNAEVTENKGITAMYKKYGYYLSLFLELLIMVGYVAKARAQKHIKDDSEGVGNTQTHQTAPTLSSEDEQQEMEDLENLKQKHSQRRMATDEDEDIHDIARMRIRQLQRVFSEAIANNDAAKADSAQNGLYRYRDMGYNINTGEFEGFKAEIGIGTGFDTPIEAVSNPPIDTQTKVLTPERELIIIRNSPRLSKYPDVLACLKAGYTIAETMQKTGVGKTIVQDVRREGKFHGILTSNNEE